MSDELKKAISNQPPETALLLEFLVQQNQNDKREVSALIHAIRDDINAVRKEDKEAHDAMIKSFKPVVDFFDNISFTGGLALKIAGYVGAFVLFVIAIYKAFTSN